MKPIVTRWLQLDQDYICNWIGNKAWTMALPWSGQADFKAAEDKGCDLDGLTLDEMRAVHDGITDAVFGVLGVDNSVASRTSLGGTAPANVRAQIDAWKERLG